MTKCIFNTCNIYTLFNKHLFIHNSEICMHFNIKNLIIGTEYTNAKFQAFLKQHKVIMYHTNSPIKSSVAERFIRTLFTKLERYKTANKTKKIVDVIQAFTNAYNNTIHKSTGLAPNAINKDNELDVWFHLYKDQNKPMKGASHQKFKLNDIVRISKSKLLFEKGNHLEIAPFVAYKHQHYFIHVILFPIFYLIGYRANWSKELYRIYKIQNTNPTTYIVKDENGIEINTALYPQQLQIIQESENVPSTPPPPSTGP